MFGHSQNTFDEKVDLGAAEGAKSPHDVERMIQGPKGLEILVCIIAVNYVIWNTV